MNEIGKISRTFAAFQSRRLTGAGSVLPPYLTFRRQALHGEALKYQNACPHVARQGLRHITSPLDIFDHPPGGEFDKNAKMILFSDSPTRSNPPMALSSPILSCHIANVSHHDSSSMFRNDCGADTDQSTGICFTNSTIIPLYRPADPSKPCLSCTRQFCLDQKLTICRGGYKIYVPVPATHL